MEESGFLIVKKKQRKKQKRPEGFRWSNTKTQRKKGMMLPLAESKCGKQDSRRKSTSSVPHSEHSSADNSDLDSVHSLPVRGSVPHPTKPHPHTTPSSSSSTPQASYADIARMPTSKLNSPSPSSKYHSGSEHDTKQDFPAISTAPLAKRKISDSREPPPFTKNTPERTSLDKDEDSSGSSEVKVRTHTKSTREINTQTEPTFPDSVETSKVSPKNEILVHKPFCPTCLLLKSECTCSKSQPCFRPKTKTIEIPPVIMDNMPPESNACNLSFGFGVDQILRMTPSKSLSSPTSIADFDEDLAGIRSHSPSPGEASLEASGLININKKTSDKSDSSHKCSPSPEKTKLSHDLPHEQSSHLRVVTYGSAGKTLLYKETKVNVERFNAEELVSYLQRSATQNATNSRVKYFQARSANKK